MKSKAWNNASVWVCICVCSILPNSLGPHRLCSMPGSSVHGICQTRILTQVSFSRDLPNPGIKPMFLTSPELTGGFFTTSDTWEIKFAMLCYAKSLQPCPTLCDPIDGSPPGSPIPGILQARTLEWVSISFSSAWKWKVKVESLSHVWLLATPWTAA